MRRALAQAALATLSGLALFASDYPLKLVAVQLVALLPVLFAITRATSRPRTALLGVAVGLGYTVPFAVVLHFPLVMGVGLAAFLTAIFVLFCLGARRALGWPAPWSALGVGAVAVLTQWLGIVVVPVFGRSQCFVRSWSAQPWAMQIGAVAGMLGLVFLLTTAQAFLLLVWRRGPGRRTAAIGLGVVVLVTVVGNGVLWRRPPRGRVTVAAMGWARLEPSRRVTAATVLARYYEPFLGQAVARGARLVVSPEVGFFLTGPEKERVLAHLTALARQHAVTLAVGYFDGDRDENHLVLIGPDGRLLGDYLKTHLIPLIEDYHAGTGRLVMTALGDVRLGGMICQDDNFVDLSRAYGRAGAQILAVPTNDWREVQWYHFSGSLWRPVESRFGIVRAATNGTSAIVTARGEVLAAWDHVRDGPGVIVADLPVFDGGSVYSVTGDGPVLALAVALLVAGIVAARRARRSPAAPDAPGASRLG